MKKTSKRLGTIILTILLIGSGYWLSSKTRPLTFGVQSVAKGDCMMQSISTRKNISYQGQPNLKLDLYVPKYGADCPAAPLAVWIHGGGFTGGSKDLDAGKIGMFTQAGWAVASIQYELASSQKPVYVPTQLHQIATAVGWLNDHHDDYDIDPSKITVAGFSAGAYLTSALVTNPTYLATAGVDSKQLACAASIDTGAYDLVRYMASDDSAVPLYQTVIPDQRTYIAYSPLQSIRKGQHVPRMLLVTRSDNIRPVLTDSFAERIRQVGGEAAVYKATTYSHHDFNARLGAKDNDPLTLRFEYFLGQCKS